MMVNRIKIFFVPSYCQHRSTASCKKRKTLYKQDPPLTDISEKPYVPLMDFLCSASKRPYKNNAPAANPDIKPIQ